jgi:hypothetical protein
MLKQVNEAVLKQRFPALWQKLTAASEVSNISFRKARGGEDIPVWEEGGRVSAWYSVYDPFKEGRRSLETALEENSRAVVFLGFGAGYQIMPFIENAAVKKIIIVDNNYGLLKKVFGVIDCCRVLNDDRVVFLEAPTVPAALEQLKNSYRPLIDGSLTLVTLRGAVERNNNFFSAFYKALEQFTDELKHDMASQAHFGKRWFINIIRNLYLGRYHAYPKRRSYPTFTVIGAGPSLQKAIPLLKQRYNEGGLLIACDAALTALKAYGITPQHVITLDAQSYINYHFIGVEAEGWTLAADLVSPPAVTRRFTPFFYAGGHPLGLLTGLPALDTSGGNVGHAALSLAYALGAGSVETIGFDFGYPDGQSYARGCYVFPIFYQRASRLLPVETENIGMMLRYSDIRRVRSADGVFYQPQLLKFYAEKFDGFKKKGGPQWPAAVRPFNADAFISWYVSVLQKILVVGLLKKNGGHSVDEHNVIVSLMPLAASFAAKHSADALAEAARFSLNFISGGVPE